MCLIFQDKLSFVLMFKCYGFNSNAIQLLFVVNVFKLCLIKTQAKVFLFCLIIHTTKEKLSAHDIEMLS